MRRCAHPRAGAGRRSDNSQGRRRLRLVRPGSSSPRREAKLQRTVRRAGDVLLREYDINVSDLDICRLAYACGDDHEIRAACGSSVQPPSPSLRLLKQDIRTVLDRYPSE